MTNKNIKVLVILGPTASGKSGLAVQLAEWIGKEKIGGYSGSEIISADSRQVYKGLDFGTGKITKTEMGDIPHHLLDVADPQNRFTAMDWKALAIEAIDDIQSRGKLPIICGGTGFYISTLIDDLGFPDVPNDEEEQKSLENNSLESLFEELNKLDPARAKTIDRKNKRRLIRAIIIARALGSVPVVKKPAQQKYDVLLIGLTMVDSDLRERIHKRLIQRISAGMIEEVERLHGEGLSYERMEELGLEYRYCSQFLQDKLTREELINTLTTKIWQYARRQKTWFRKDKRIQWFTPNELAKIKDSISAFISR